MKGPLASGPLAGVLFDDKDNDIVSGLQWGLVGRRFGMLPVASVHFGDTVIRSIFMSNNFGRGMRIASRIFSQASEAAILERACVWFVHVRVCVCAFGQLLFFLLSEIGMLTI